MDVLATALAGLLAAALVAAAVAAARLRRRLRRLEAQAITDPLTGAFNRRHMEACLALAIERRRRTGEPASILLVDVDRFKAINDAIGHAAGDRVLRAIAALVMQRARKLDVLFRIGGEEFVLLLTGAALDDAVKVADTFRALIESSALVEGRTVSVSVGVSELRYGYTVASWVEDADAALYRAKRAGRNRVAGHPGRAARAGFAVIACCVVLALSGCSGGAGGPAASAAVAASATPTLDGVRNRGYVRCGVSTGIPGFSAVDGQGRWHGVDVDVCRAIAAAVLGDAEKVRYTPLTSAQRFTALQSGEIDVLSRSTTISFQREAQLGIAFPAIDWYDGTAFIVRASSGVKSPKDLDGATICIQPGTTTELDVADFFRANHLKFTPVVIERLEEASAAYFSGRCDAFSQDQSALAGVRARAPNPPDHVVLPQVISKSPFGPGVMPNDIVWMTIVRWSVFAMIDAEDLGLTSSTVAEAISSDDPLLQRFVGTSGGFGPMLGLDPRWAYRIVEQVGTIGESFDRNIRPMGVDRGLNRLWKDGGLLYAPDIR